MHASYQPPLRKVTLELTFLQGVPLLQMLLEEVKWAPEKRNYPWTFKRWTNSWFLFLRLQMKSPIHNRIVNKPKRFSRCGVVGRPPQRKEERCLWAKLWIMHCPSNWILFAEKHFHPQKECFLHLFQPWCEASAWFRPGSHRSPQPRPPTCLSGILEGFPEILITWKN